MAGSNEEEPFTISTSLVKANQTAERKESLRAMVPSVVEQFYNLLNALSGFPFWKRYVSVHTQNFRNVALFPAVREDGDGILVICYFSNRPVILTAETSVGDMHQAYYRGGWTGHPEDYQEFAVPGTESVLMANADFIGIQGADLRGIIAGMASDLPRRSYLTFIPQRRIDGHLLGDSWQMAVAAALKGFSPAVYTGVSDSSANWMATGVPAKARLATAAHMSFYTMTQFLSPDDRLQFHQAEALVPFRADKTPLDLVMQVMALTWAGLAAVQIAQFDIQRHLISAQSAQISTQAVTLKESAADSPQGWASMIGGIVNSVTPTTTTPDLRQAVGDLTTIDPKIGERLVTLLEQHSNMNDPSVANRIKQLEVTAKTFETRVQTGQLNSALDSFGALYSIVAQKLVPDSRPFVKGQHMFYNPTPAAVRDYNNTIGGQALGKVRADVQNDMPSKRTRSQKKVAPGPATANQAKSRDQEMRNMVLQQLRSAPPVPRNAGPSSTALSEM